MPSPQEDIANKLLERREGPPAMGDIPTPPASRSPQISGDEMARRLLEIRPTPEMPTAADIVPFVGETLGATGGAGIAAAMGLSGPYAIPLAMIFTAAGSVAGREFGSDLVGKEMSGAEVAETATISAITGGLGATLKPLIRMFTGIPAVQRTQKMMQFEIDRQQALQGFQIPGQFFRRVNAQREMVASRAQKELDFIATAPADEIIAKYGTIEAAQLRTVRLNAKISKILLGRVNDAFDPQLRKGLLNPEFSAGQAALMMQLPREFPGSTAGALAFLYSATLGGQAFLGAAEAGGVTAVMGWLLGKMGQRASLALVRNRGFRNWITNAKPNSVGEMLITFISEVQMGAKNEEESKAAEKFMGFLIKQVDSVIKGTIEETKGTGKLVQGVTDTVESIGKTFEEENRPIQIPVIPGGISVPEANK